MSSRLVIKLVVLWLYFLAVVFAANIFYVWNNISDTHSIFQLQGRVHPHFSPRHTEIWNWGWEKMGKKVYEKRGKQNFLYSK